MSGNNFFRVRVRVRVRVPIVFPSSAFPIGTRTRTRTRTRSCHVTQKLYFLNHPSFFNCSLLYCLNFILELPLYVRSALSVVQKIDLIACAPSLERVKLFNASVLSWCLCVSIILFNRCIAIVLKEPHPT